MPMVVTTKDCTALSDAELEEMADLGVEPSGFDIGFLSKQREEWVLVTHAREENKLRGFAFSTLERIGGTPSLLIGVASFVKTGSAEPALKAVMRDLYRRAVLALQELSGQHVEVIHLVGGGARNDLLCQLTADACGLPVVAGPAEAAALGNALVQARALGAAPGDLDGLRALLRATQPLRTFRPSSGSGTGQSAREPPAAPLRGPSLASSGAAASSPGAGPRSSRPQSEPPQASATLALAAAA